MVVPGNTKEGRGEEEDESTCTRNKEYSLNKLAKRIRVVSLPRDDK
jgi:hypothetical protein